MALSPPPLDGPDEDPELLPEPDPLLEDDDETSLAPESLPPLSPFEPPHPPIAESTATSSTMMARR